MGNLKIEKNVGGIEGLCVITPEIHRDRRGYFMETYSRRDLAKAGIKVNFVQDNQSQSAIHVLRGLHFQKEYPQAKLVRVQNGSVFDVAVDLRPGSPTFGKWYGLELSDINLKQFLIPRGFAHGFFVTSITATFCYKCDDFYYPNDEGGIAWNDPSLNIQWPGIQGVYDGTASCEGYTIKDYPITMSEKDQKWPTFKQLFAREIK